LPQPPDLRAQAFDFARETSELLNGTVAHGIRVRALVSHDGAIGWMGYRINAVEDLPGELIPLTLGQAADCFLHVIHTLTLDEAGEHLQATKTGYGVYVGSGSLDEADLLVRYDYDREPDHPYADAHMQVRGDSRAVDHLNERLGLSKSLEKLHFPVGGRRYRPALEDVVEFLITEGFVQSREGWRDVIGYHRTRFHRRQLRAAIRQDPETASGALAKLGFTVQPPAGE
jgi:hypothetical protein